MLPDGDAVQPGLAVVVHPVKAQEDTPAVLGRESKAFLLQGLAPVIVPVSIPGMGKRYLLAREGQRGIGASALQFAETSAGVEIHARSHSATYSFLLFSC